MTLKEMAVGDVGTALILVLGAVGFVLLIACTNAANLLVARTTHRSRELAVRAALGASRGRLLQHLLSESALLAFGGALLGLVLTVGGIKLLTTVGANFIPRTQEIALDGAALWFLIAVTLASGLLFGLIPSLQGAKSRFQLALRSESRSATEGVRSRRLQRAMVVSQFAVAAPLLVGAGLLISSLAKLWEVDPGFDTHNLLSLSVTLPMADYPDGSDIVAFWNEALPRISALPGVQGTVAPDGRPPGFVSMVNNFDLLDQPTPANESQPATPWVAVTPGYFDLLGIPLLEGRVIDERDRSDGPPVAVVDEAWARRFYPNESAVGRQFYSGGSTTNPLTVVGVVGNVKQMGLAAPDEGIVYWPQAFNNTRGRFVILRTAVTIEEGFADSLASPRYLTILVAAFAGIALLLSIIGVYGVMSYFVQQHTRDIGIRLALGGGPSNVLRLVVGQGMRLVGVGVAVGIGAALALTRYMSSLLFGVGATDTLTFVSVSGAMLGVALLACFLPARRAAGVDPALTLREE
jgi:putative ABC transport system permease protein